MPRRSSGPRSRSAPSSSPPCPSWRWPGSAGESSAGGHGAPTPSSAALSPGAPPSSAPLEGGGNRAPLASCCRRYPALLDTLLKQMLQLVRKFETRLAEKEAKNQSQPRQQVMEEQKQDQEQSSSAEKSEGAGEGEQLARCTSPTAQQRGFDLLGSGLPLTSADLSCMQVRRATRRTCRR